MSVVLISVMALLFGLALGVAAIRFRVEGNPVVERIDAILPQTQCGQCGYPGCRPYAQAIADDGVEINQCPPGGEAGMLALADLLGREPRPLENDDEVPGDVRRLALIDEETCIGCTKCIQICPVDAIVGAPKCVHTVLDMYCTGCKLCLPPLCPVPDCIVMVDDVVDVKRWKWPMPVEIGRSAAS